MRHRNIQWHKETYIYKKGLEEQHSLTRRPFRETLTRGHGAKRQNKKGLRDVLTSHPNSQTQERIVNYLLTPATFTKTLIRKTKHHSRIRHSIQGDLRDRLIISTVKRIAIKQELKDNKVFHTNSFHRNPQAKKIASLDKNAANWRWDALKFQIPREPQVGIADRIILLNTDRP